MASKIVLLILIQIGIVQVAIGQTCDRSQTIKNFKTSLETINLQKTQVDQLLQGAPVMDFSPAIIFGHDFNIEQTSEKIDQIKKQIKEKEAIALEHRNLFSCLELLKMSQRSTQFKQASLELSLQKIELLLQNEKLGDGIRNTDIAEDSLPSLREKIDQDNQDVLKLKKELEDELIENTSESAKEKSTQKRDSLTYKNELTRFRIELLDLKLTANKQLEEKVKTFEKFNTRLLELAANIKERDSAEENFFAVESLWLNLARENYYDLFLSKDQLSLPEVPSLPKKVEEQTSEVLKMHQDLQSLRVQIIKDHTLKKTQEIKLLNQLVSNSNSIRASYYKELGHGYFISSLGKIESYKLFKNEITAAPLRVLSFFYRKFLYVKEKLSLGKAGYVDLFGHFIVFALLILFFYTMKNFYGRVSSKIDGLFRILFKSFQNSFLLKKIYGFWVKLKESTVPVMWYFTLELIEKMEYFNDLYLLIEILQIYLGAQILEVLVKVFLGAVSRLDVGNFQTFKVKSSETSKRFKNIFLFYFMALLFIEVTVGKVYLYTLIYYLVLFYSLYQFVKESARWEGEFIKYAEKKFAGLIVERYTRLIAMLPKKLNAAFMLVFIWFFQFFDLFIGLTENFEISKKVSANLFKKQIESIEAENGSDGKIPEEYREHFSPRSIDTTEEYVDNSQNLEAEVEREINEWLTLESDEHSLVIFGDKGIGKTTLLKRVEIDLNSNENLDIKYAKIPSKTVVRADLFKFIQDLFEDKTESFDIYRIDKALNKKTVVILDEAQNIYLSETGGFEAYYGLMNILNMNTDNIYWVMSFNKYSWLYLDRAFGRTKFVRNIFEVKGWTDTKIKELIVKRHKKADYKLSYDLLINATRSQDEIDKYASIESKFFKLLWELSRGNPRAALFLWLSALSRKNAGTFNVNIPKEIELDGIESLPDDLMFVLAEVLKHENLSSGEIEKTTNLQRGIVRYALKLGLEKRFFFRDERHRYMVEISTQYGLIRYLRLKNFIYGS